jgi:signal transduction histidine kinase
MGGAGQPATGRDGWRALASAEGAPGVLAASGYLLLSFPIGLFWFVVVVVGLSAGASLVIVWVGLPVLAATLLLAQVGAGAERGRLRSSLGIDLPQPYRPLPSGSHWSRWWACASDPAVWRDVVYLVLLFPLGTIWFSLVIFLGSLTLALTTMPLWYRLPSGGHAPLFSAVEEPMIMVDTLAEALGGTVIGIVLGLAAVPVVRYLAVAQAIVACTLLGPPPSALRARVQTLEASRARTVEAAAAERRRIERDLHDGAQQRLVALAMDLGMAREKFADEPEAARALVEEAHQEAKRALAELRDLARGIHPAVLSDRGLDAALSALAARSPVPVEVRVDLGGRLREPVEAIAYFVAAEALANVAKHAAATAATVRVSRTGDLAVLEVSDDGLGGADPARGSGLAGLADRVAGIDGRLTVTSPPGGPTVVRAELPCGS